MLQAIQTVVLIAGIEADGYELNTGERGFSLTGIAALCSTSFSSVRSFARTKAFKTLQALDSTVRLIVQDVAVADSNVKSITWVSCAFATEYVLQQTIKGNETAENILRAITQVTLEARLQQAFTGTEMPEDVRVSREQDLYLLQQARFATKASHSAFLNACYRHHYPAGKVHDALTTKIAGMTAAEARQLEMVLSEDDPDVGLAHYHDADLLTQVAQAKNRFANLRGGTWEEKLARI